MGVNRFVVCAMLIGLGAHADADDPPLEEPKWSANHRYGFRAQYTLASEHEMRYEGRVFDLWTGGSETVIGTWTRRSCTMATENPKECAAENEESARPVRNVLRAKKYRGYFTEMTSSLTPTYGAASLVLYADDGKVLSPVLTPEWGRARPDWLYFERNEQNVTARLAIEGRGEREFAIGSITGGRMISWSPDAQWIFVSTDEDLLLLPAIGRVNLLDSGAGQAKVEALTATLKKSGYGPDLLGKATTPRKSTEIFVHKGFEEDGKRIAKALGLSDDVVKPLTWASEHGIVVAAGSEK